jgi:hypothetical protein
MRYRFRRVSVLCCLAVPLILPFPVGSVNSDTTRIDRLVTLCKVWSAVKLFHPYLAYRDIDWDRALVDAIPRVNAAQTSQDYAAAVQSMLDALNDPATRVVRNERAAAPVPPDIEREPTQRMTDDGIMIISVRRYSDLTDYAGAREKFRAISKQLAKTKGVLFDLRSSAPLNEAESGVLAYALSFGVEKSLSSVALSLPGERFRMHHGFAGQNGTAGFYYSGFYIRDGKRIPPGEGVPGGPSVFLVNKWSELPLVAFGLQAAGQGFLVAEGEVHDASAVEKYRLPLEAGTEVQIRLSELSHEDGTSGIHLDLEVPEEGQQGQRALAGC